MGTSEDFWPTNLLEALCTMKNLPIIPLSPPHSGCTECPLHTLQGTTVGVPGVRCTDAQPPGTHPVLAVIGQNPGFQENQEALPFVGQTGDWLHNRYLAGIHAKTLASVYLLNAYRCYHPTGNPTPKYVRSCLGHLTNDFKTIASYHPHTPTRLILALGASAVLAVSLFDKGPRTLTEAFTAQGRLITVPGDPPTTWSVFATYHPAAVMRDRNLATSVHDHLQLVLDVLTGTTPAPTPPKRVPVKTPGEAFRCPTTPFSLRRTSKSSSPISTNEPTASQEDSTDNSSTTP